MKNLIIGLCLLFFSALRINAQEVKIKAIPYPMHFENTVDHYEVKGDDHLSFSSPAKSDLYYSPNGKYIPNKSPRLLFKPDSNFIFSAKINIDFHANWDAGDLIIYNDARSWAKFCFERDFQKNARVVSVVCNQFADDSNAMLVEGNEIYYKICGSLSEKKFVLLYSTEGISWFPIRTFALINIDNLKIGFSVQSPAGGGSSASFSEITYKNQKVKNWRKGE